MRFGASPPVPLGLAASRLPPSIRSGTDRPPARLPLSTRRRFTHSAACGDRGVEAMPARLRSRLLSSGATRVSAGPRRGLGGSRRLRRAGSADRGGPRAPPTSRAMRTARPPRRSGRRRLRRATERCRTPTARHRGRDARSAGGIRDGCAPFSKPAGGRELPPDDGVYRRATETRRVLGAGPAATDRAPPRRAPPDRPGFRPPATRPLNRSASRREVGGRRAGRRHSRAKRIAAQGRSGAERKLGRPPRVNDAWVARFC